MPGDDPHAGAQRVVIAESPCSDRSKVSFERLHPPRYDPAHGRLRPDDPDPEMDPAGRPSRSSRPRVPARGEARARPLPLSDGERHRVHAEPARSRPHAPEGAARALGPHRLHGLRRGRDRAFPRDQRRRLRPGSQRRRPDRRVRDRGARRPARRQPKSTSTACRHGSTTTASRTSRSASRSTSGSTR